MHMARRRDLPGQVGSRHVYADLGFANADAMLRKAKIASEISSAMRRVGCTENEAARRLRVPRAKLSKAMRGQYERIAERTLKNWLDRLSGKKKRVDTLADWLGSSPGKFRAQSEALGWVVRDDAANCPQEWVADRFILPRPPALTRRIKDLCEETPLPPGSRDVAVPDCRVRKFAVHCRQPQEERAVESSARQERFEARIRSEEKRTLERAAELTGRTLTDFVMGSAHAAALETIERYEGMVLRDPRDREAFVEAMLKPRAPSRTLKAAAARYKAAFKQSK